MCLGVLRQVVLAADDVGDGHRRVVYDDREVVERGAVVADDDEVATEVGDVELDVAPDDIVERDEARPDPEPQGTGPPSASRAARSSDVSEAQRPTYFGGSLAASWARPVRRQLLGRAVAGVGLVVGEQACGGGARRAAGAPSGGTARTGPRAASPATSGPSSQRSPSQCRPWPNRR